MNFLRVDKLIGSLIAVAGMAFLILLIFLRVSGQLIGDIKVSLFFLCTGGVLVWIGCAWLFSKPEPQQELEEHNYDCYFLKLRRPVEWGAAVGMLLTLIRASSLLYGVDLMPTKATWAFVATPILIGGLTLRILKPGAFQSGVFPAEVVSRWSVATRKVVNVLVRVGWLGYPGIALAWPDTPWAGHIGVQIVASILISLLYASQVLVLHFGETRLSESVPNSQVNR